MATNFFASRPPERRPLERRTLAPKTYLANIDGSTQNQTPSGILDFADSAALQVVCKCPQYR